MAQEFLQRMYVEKAELDDKVSKLGNFIEFNPAYTLLSPVEQYMLNSQLQHMIRYARVLGERISFYEKV